MNPETLDWLLEHASAAYKAERDAADKIKDRVTFVSGLLITPLTGVIIFVANGFIDKRPILDTWNVLLFALPLGLAVVLLALAIVVVLRISAKGYAYEHLPLPSQLSQYANAHPSLDAVLGDLKSNMLARYESAIDHNNAQNLRRSSGLLKAMGIAVLAIPLVAVAALRYAAVAIVSEKKPLEIAIVKDVSAEEKKHEQREAARAEGADHHAAAGTRADPETTTTSLPVKPNDQ